MMEMGVHEVPVNPPTVMADEVDLADDEIVLRLVVRELGQAQTPLALVVGGQEVTVHFDADGLTAWVTDASGELMMTVLAYESGWKSFFPETRVWSHGGSQ